MERRRALKLFLIVTLFVAVFESEVEGARTLKAANDTVDRPNLVGTLDLPGFSFNVPGLGVFPCPGGGAVGGFPGGGSGGGLPGGGAGGGLPGGGAGGGLPGGGAGGGLPGGGAAGGLPGGGAGVGWDKICALFPMIPGCHSGAAGGESTP